MNKKVNSLFTESVYSVFRYVKVIKIHRDYPELTITNVLPPFLWFTVYISCVAFIIILYSCRYKKNTTGWNVCGDGL